MRRGPIAAGDAGRRAASGTVCGRGPPPPAGAGTATVRFLVGGAERIGEGILTSSPHWHVAVSPAASSGAVIV
jgi:hypothetical protein